MQSRSSAREMRATFSHIRLRPQAGFGRRAWRAERKVLDSILVICPAGYFVAPLVVVFGGKSPAQ
jgi:hypothetical protein